MLSNNLNEAHQSASECSHSTETALLRVKKDIMMLTNQSKAMALVLLDRSAAFDTVNRGVLFSRLGKLFGLSDLKEHSQRVLILSVCQNVSL